MRWVWRRPSQQSIELLSIPDRIEVVRVNSSKLIFGCLTTLGLAVAAASNAQADEADAERDAIAERLKPVGEVCLQGQDCGSSAAASSSDTAEASSDDIDGEAIYARVCFACHDNGIAGAPAIGDNDAWASRIEQGWDTLLDHSINGFNAMPARGGNPSLSDDEVAAATAHLLEPVMDVPALGGAEVEAPVEEAPAEAADEEASDGNNGEDSTAESGSGFDGEALYSSGGCATCHDIGLINAPPLGDSDAWAERIDKGIDELYASSINGIGAMPPKGGNMSLDDEEVQAIVDYMVAEAE